MSASASSSDIKWAINNPMPNSKTWRDYNLACKILDDVEEKVRSVISNTMSGLCNWQDE